MIRAARPGWLLLLGVAGCAPGVAWRYDFASTYAESKARNRLTLVYFRQWFLPECARVEEQVFGTVALRDATRDIACVRYEMYAGDPLSAAWNVARAPAFIIVDTDGAILARRDGVFNVADLLGAIRTARTVKYGLATQPAPRP